MLTMGGVIINGEDASPSRQQYVVCGLEDLNTRFVSAA